MHPKGEIMPKETMNKPWKGICVKSCWFAKHEKCKCRCKKQNHGKGRQIIQDKVKLEKLEVEKGDQT